MHTRPDISGKDIEGTRMLTFWDAWGYAGTPLRAMPDKPFLSTQVHPLLLPIIVQYMVLLLVFAPCQHLPTIHLPGGAEIDKQPAPNGCLTLWHRLLV